MKESDNSLSEKSVHFSNQITFRNISYKERKSCLQSQLIDSEILVNFPENLLQHRKLLNPFEGH